MRDSAPTSRSQAASSDSQQVFLSGSEERIVQDILRCVGHDERLYRRAKAVLLYARGRSIRSIACELGTCRSRVRGWIRKFEENRLEGLGEAGRPGRPPKFTPRLKQQILELALASPRAYGLRRDTWTGESLRAAILSLGLTQSISQSSLWRLLSEADIRLNGGRQAAWEEPDRSLEPILEEVTHTLHQDQEAANFYSFGVKSLARYRRTTIWNRGSAAEAPPTHVVACLDIRARRVRSCCLVRRNDPGLSRFWKEQLDSGTSCSTHVFLDEQDQRLVERSLGEGTPARLHVVPSKHSWLNRIEPWFSTLDASLQREAAHGRRGDLRQAVTTFTERWNLQAAG